MHRTPVFVDVIFLLFSILVSNRSSIFLVVFIGGMNTKFMSFFGFFFATDSSWNDAEESALPGTIYLRSKKFIHHEFDVNLSSFFVGCRRWIDVLGIDRKSVDDRLIPRLS